MISIILTILMWYGALSLTCVLGLIGIIVYDRIKYGPTPVCNDEDA